MEYTYRSRPSPGTHSTLTATRKLSSSSEIVWITIKATVQRRRSANKKFALELLANRLSLFFSTQPLPTSRPSADLHVQPGRVSIRDPHILRHLLRLVSTTQKPQCPELLLARNARLPARRRRKNIFDVEIGDDVHKKLEDLNKDILRAELANDRENHKRLAPVYAKRREYVKTVPKFWSVALMNCGQFGIHVQHIDDQKALIALEDVWVERDPAESRTFSLEFHFAENPYFSDKVLKKEYKFIAPPAAKDEVADEHGITPSMLDFDWERDVAPQATKISWKSDTVNLTKLHPRVTDDDDVSDPGSFFNFFEKESDPFDIGLVIANDIYPEAIDWFTGKAGSGVDISDEEDSEDEDDEDEDAEEIDLEKPETKKQRRV
ncbi:hypothetical protein DFH11DRAFT_82001 [Phellopilus nigrolimitatus]|nr:hypothetical protein DFH11DRAFT_82001 [Phellopilus nigrolimitatus]